MIDEFDFDCYGLLISIGIAYEVKKVEINFWKKKTKFLIFNLHTIQETFNFIFGSFREVILEYPVSFHNILIESDWVLKIFTFVHLLSQIREFLVDFFMKKFIKN